MIKLLRSILLPARFFIAICVLVMLFGIGYLFPLLFSIAKTALVLLIVLTIADVAIIFGKQVLVNAHRKLPQLFSLGDDNEVELCVTNKSGLQLKGIIIDELPDQFQKRDFRLPVNLTAGETQKIKYHLRPVVRGAYHFHDIHLYLSSRLGLVQRKVSFNSFSVVKVFPSVIQMKKMELKALARISHFSGIKKMRRLGHSYEFEQIKSYVRGDDIRSINWKATGRRAELMVNQYEDERAQQVYAIIDKSRSMQLPFHDLSLMDYAVNTSLSILNIALQKHDKAGLITFAEQMGPTIKADRKKGQLKKILTTLYDQQESTLEPNYEELYFHVKHVIKGRSLIFLFSNFESQYALEKVIHILRRLNHMHLLVVIFFENAEMISYSRQQASNLEDIYLKAITQNFVSAKYQMVQLLQKYRIQTILCQPRELSVKTVNKYLELKSRGLI